MDNENIMVVTVAVTAVMSIFIFILMDNEKIMVVTVAVTAVMSAWASSNGTTWEQYTVQCTLSICITVHFSKSLWIVN